MEMAEGEPVNKPEEQIEGEAEETDHQNARKDVIDPDEALRPHHHGTNAIGGRDDLRDHQIGPAYREHLPGGVNVCLLYTSPSPRD